MAFYFNNTETMDATSEKLVDKDNTTDINILLITLEAYTEALHMPELEHCTMSHCNKDHIIIFDRFNERLSLLFEIDLNPKMKDLINAEYIVQCILSGDKYTFAEYIASSRSVKK
jgi:hypothetical protein